jgi:hypothetical protein
MAPVAVEFPVLTDAGPHIVDRDADFLPVRRPSHIADSRGKSVEFPGVRSVGARLVKVGFVGEKQTTPVRRPHQVLSIAVN